MKSIAAILCLLLVLLVGCATQPAPRTRSSVSRVAAPSQTVTVSWQVLRASEFNSPAQFTGLEQRDSLVGPWINVATFEVPPAGDTPSFSVTFGANQASDYWRAWTR